MAGKYTKQGVFPIILDGSEEITDSVTWGEGTGKVGLIENTGTNTITFDGTNFPADNSGDSVYVVSLQGTCTVVITPDPFVEDDDRLALSAGESVWLTYHHDHRWLAMGNVTLA